MDQMIIDNVSAVEAAITMSVEEWFDIYGVAILKREEKKAAREAKHARMAKLVTGLKAKAAGTGPLVICGSVVGVTNRGNRQ